MVSAFEVLLPATELQCHLPANHLLLCNLSHFCRTCFSMGDKGVQVSVRLYVRPFVRPSVRPGRLSVRPSTVFYRSFWNFADVFFMVWSVRVAKRLALPTSDHGVAGLNPAGGEILPEPKQRFIAQSLSCSPFHRLERTEILLKGRKTLTHPSIFMVWGCACGLDIIVRLFFITFSTFWT